MAETSSNKGRGSKLVHFTDPCNNMRKSKASDDGQMPRKSMKCRSFTNPSEHIQVSLEDIKIQRRKRKSSGDVDPPRKKSGINPDEPDVISGEESSIHVQKREASDDGGAPTKKMSNSSTSNIKSGTAESNSCEDKYGDNSLIFNNVSPEEEKIYQLSSSANTNRDDFEKKYFQLAPLSTGGFGSVYKGYPKEDLLPIILKQLVDAAVHMHSRGIFHRDIKLENVLVWLEFGEPTVRIVDLGCGSFSTKKPFSSFCGHGHFTTTDIINGQIQISPKLSTDCKILLNWCLAIDPAERATLEELQLCPALREISPPPVQGCLSGAFS